MTTALDGLITLDEQHESMLRNPQFDPKEQIDKGLKNALTILVDALALVDGLPGRAEYAAQLSEMHSEEPDPVVEMLDTVVTWLQDAREGNPGMDRAAGA